MDTVKVTVNLPVKVWAKVVEMAEREGIAKTEMLRRCISTEVYRQEVEAEGGRLLVEEANGQRGPIHFNY